MLTEEGRKRISEANKGNRNAAEHVVPEWLKAKVGVGSRGRKTFLGRRHTAESRAKISSSRRGKDISPEARSKQTQAIRGRKHAPGCNHCLVVRTSPKVFRKPIRPNAIEVALGELVGLMYPQAERIAEHPVGRMRIDVAVPSLKMGFEADGEYWHDPVKDASRDAFLCSQGWFIHRYPGRLLKRLSKLPAFREAVERSPQYDRAMLDRFAKLKADGS